MEEDIKIIEEMLRLNKNRIEPQIINAIENLINKNKELEVMCEENQDEIELLEKIIELMARYIEACTESCPLDLHNEEPRNDCENCGAGTVPYKCFIDYFRKKVKGE